MVALFGKKSKGRSPFGLFESCREKQISLCFMSRLGKLMHFGGRMGLRMKLIAKQGRIHGHQLQTGGQGQNCAFSHFSTRSPRTD